MNRSRPLTRADIILKMAKERNAATHPPEQAVRSSSRHRVASRRLLFDQVCYKFNAEYSDET